MARILCDVYSLVGLEQILPLRVEEVSVAMLTSVAPIVENLILCDEIVFEPKQARYWIGPARQAFPSALTPLSISADSATRAGYALTLLRSVPPVDYPVFGQQTGFEYRALLYSELARCLDLYYAPHPRRSQFLRKILPTMASKKAADLALGVFERRIQTTSAFQVAGIDVRVPPVVDYVRSFAKKNGLTLQLAIQEIRESKNAVRFRRWCSEIDHKLKGLEGRSSVGEIQRLCREIDSAADVWSSDLDAGRRFEWRKINLSKVWGLGHLIETLGFSEWEIRDPVLLSKWSHLFFLNDIYRAP